MAMTIVAVVLAVSGLMTWWSAFVDIQFFYTNSNGTVVTPFATKESQYCAVSYGAATLALAYGVYRRRLIAWRAGLIFLVGGWAYSAFEIFTWDDMPKNAAIIIFFGVASSIVMFLWMRWWYAQRVYFHD